GNYRIRFSSRRGTSKSSERLSLGPLSEIHKCSGQISLLYQRGEGKELWLAFAARFRGPVLGMGLTT
ncbi:unnamed protein product, partial [Amoebophrya sp. A25]